MHGKPPDDAALLEAVNRIPKNTVAVSIECTNEVLEPRFGLMLPLEIPALSTAVRLCEAINARVPEAYRPSARLVIRTDEDDYVSVYLVYEREETDEEHLRRVRAGILNAEAETRREQNLMHYLMKKHGVNHA